MENLKKPDSLILDMDGTLWDNVNTYAQAWNIGLRKCGYDRTLTRDDMIGLMGKEARVILDTLMPEWTKDMKENLFEIVIESYQELVPSMKPIVYEGVIEGIKLLSIRYKLFLLSNCEKDGLVNFMNHTKTEHLITDYMEHGMNLKPKNYNMQLLCNKHSLKSPVYVGDTNSDSIESSLAGIPFVYMTYGFGHTDNYTLKFNTFRDFVQYFINLANNQE